MTDEEKCPRTGKPRRFCCQGRPWRDMTTGDLMRWDEPLPQIVIDVALLKRLDPHDLMDAVEDDGWETHDRGFAEKVLLTGTELRHESRTGP